MSRKMANGEICHTLGPLGEMQPEAALGRQFRSVASWPTVA